MFSNIGFPLYSYVSSVLTQSWISGVVIAKVARDSGLLLIVRIRLNKLYICSTINCCVSGVYIAPCQPGIE